MSSLFSRFDNLAEKRTELESRLSDPALLSNQAEYRKVVQEHFRVAKLDELYQLFRYTEEELVKNQELLRGEDDLEMQGLIRAEIDDLRQRREALEGQLLILLLPRDPNDDKNILLEIRAGTGGDEAALFAGDLFKMYSRYAELQGWKVEVMSSNPSDKGGFKEIIALISGVKVYSRLKYESGVHRVQRVPATEAQGRIHTSAVTVAILPEAEEVELNIAPNELRYDVFRSSGPGGQSVNTTDSAIRVTHLPTGMVVICQDEKSQHKNKAQALKVLLARLLDRMQQESSDRMALERKSQVGSGDRSERIRTYNFPQGRLSDHRINLTLYKLDDLMLGKLDDVINPLIAHHQAEALKTIQ